MNIVEIADLRNPALEVYARLTNGQLRRMDDASEGVMVVESFKAIEHALDAGCTPLSMLMERKHVEGSARSILQRCPSMTVYTGEREVLESLTGYALTRGILCAMKRPVLPTVEETVVNGRRIAVLEKIGDPTNVGAIFRSAAGLGVDAILVTSDCCDPLHRRAIRVSMGTVFQIPWSRLGEGAGDWAGSGVDRLKGLGFTTVSLALTEDSLEIDDPRLQRAEKLAVVLGAEGDGLAETTIAGCDYTVRIPMLNGVDSLNVAAASAVAFWQLRERTGRREDRRV
ncbi:MAG: RNA methyltransferase [Christensenellales bacterium]|nr:RNA methyltransferase [Christensenellales bacterium]